MIACKDCEYYNSCISIAAKLMQNRLYENLQINDKTRHNKCLFYKKQLNPHVKKPLNI